MAKVELSKMDIEILQMDETGKKYIEYNDKVGGKAFGYCEGMPDFKIDERFGGIVGLYDECIKRNVTWEKLLNTDGNFDELGGDQ